MSDINLHAAKAVWRPLDATSCLLVTCIALAVFSFLYGLGSYPFRDINEGLYAEIAREMLASGNFVVPHLLGVPYIEKPPLLYWMMAAAFHVFGPWESSARLIPSASMLMLACSLTIVWRQLGHLRAGLYATIILSTAAPVILLSHTILFDPLLTALIGACLLAFFRAYMTSRRLWLRIAAVFLALAILTKGGVALVLIGGIIALFLVLMRDRAALLFLVDPVAITLFLAIALPWHVVAAAQQKDFTWFYFINEHVLRFLGMREPHDYQEGPLYYYLPRMLLMLLPWAPLLCLLAHSKSARSPNASLVRLCQAWILVPFVFFSLSQAKAQYYLLITVPAFALWLGIEIECRLNRKHDRALIHCLAAAVGIAIAGATVLWFGSSMETVSFNIMVLAGAGVLAFLAAWHFLARHLPTAKEPQRWIEGMLFTVGLLVIPILTSTLRIVEARTQDSSRDIAYALLAHGENRDIFLYRRYEDAFSSLPFYLDRKVKIVDSTSKDLWFGCHISDEENSACISHDEFMRYSKNHRVALIATGDDLQKFKAFSSRMRWKMQKAGKGWILLN